MKYADNSCTYQEKYEPEHVYIYTGPCIQTGKEVSVTLPADGLFKYRRGAHLQDAFPELSPGDREFLISGMSSDAFDELFSEEDEPEMDPATCAAADLHLTDCDDDGFCNYCGEQESFKFAKDLKEGDLVDLSSCPFMKDHASAEMEYAQVVEVVRENEQCVRVTYDGVDQVGYKPEQMLTIKENHEKP